MVDQRKKIEQGKEYGFKNNKAIYYNMTEMLKIAGKDRANMLDELGKFDKNCKMEMENVRLEATEEIKKLKDAQELFTTSLGTKMEKFETKMNQMETAQVLRGYTD